jgi:ABC-2 type transport system ATP-binding protein
MAEFLAGATAETVRVRTPQAAVLATALTAGGGTVDLASSSELEVRGLSEDQVAEIAFTNGVRIQHLAASRASLEQVYLELTADSVDYSSAVPDAVQPTSLEPARNGTEA